MVSAQRATCPRVEMTERRTEVSTTIAFRIAKLLEVSSMT